MKKTEGKKAFTLTELLVVVIVIGVLAAVVLPKFSKVIETRKTTEAEEIMEAVRTEQENRCALDKNYTTDAATANLASLSTKYFNYALKSTGIEAQSKGKYAYTLKMPSYRDGRLCCDSAEQCSKLNKDYPLCSELTARSDYADGVECKADTAGSDDTPKACLGAQPASSQACNGCGTQTRTITCNSATGEWVPGAFGECSKTEEECKPDDSKPDNCGEGRILDSFSGACVCAAEANGTSEYTSCSGESQEQCPVAGGGEGKVKRFWNSDTCKCESECVPTLYWRCQRGSASLALQQNEYESESSAKAACEAGDKNAYYISQHGGEMDCSKPNQPCKETKPWTKKWYCTDQYVACGAGLGQCDPCTCWCMVD